MAIAVASCLQPPEVIPSGLPIASPACLHDVIAHPRERSKFSIFLYSPLGDANKTSSI